MGLYNPLHTANNRVFFHRSLEEAMISMPGSPQEKSGPHFSWFVHQQKTLKIRPKLWFLSQERSNTSWHKNVATNRIGSMKSWVKGVRMHGNGETEVFPYMGHLQPETLMLTPLRPPSSPASNTPKKHQTWKTHWFHAALSPAREAFCVILFSGSKKEGLRWMSLFLGSFNITFRGFKWWQSTCPCDG